MSLQINTNVMALNAQRNLSVTSGKMARALEQLSSGLRVNRAADDAAGLAISEKMRAQIRGMRQGLRNAQDGISMIQTAEGALSATHDVLQRMRELTVQAGSSTLSSSDRTAIGEELLTLRNEIDNIADRTRFNGLSLLTGSLSATAAGTLTTNTVSDADGDQVTAEVDVTGVDPSHTFTLSSSGGADLTITNTTTNVSQTVTVASMTADGASQLLNFDALGVKIRLEVSAYNDGITGADLVNTGTNPLSGATLTLSGSGAATYRIGSDVNDNVSVEFSDLRSLNLGPGSGQMLSDLIADNGAVSTTAETDTLLTALDTAIDQVSRQRAKLGAAQNRMETAVNSLGVAVENLSASESRIRDADIAAVSSELIARQIMQQAGVAVLAQANAAPQSVLSLLQQG